MTHIPTSDTSIGFAANDRAASYGDGVFTTMLVKDGKVALRDRHVQRLTGDAARLGLTLEKEAVEQAIADAARGINSGVLKLLVSAGEGGRGYARNEHTRPTLHFSEHARPLQYATQTTRGLSVIEAGICLSSQPVFAGIKHLNRLEQVLIKREIGQSEADDALVCDYQGVLVEASAANVFWYQHGSWFTPDLSESGVNGVMRGFVIDWMRKCGIPLQIGRFSLTQCRYASSMMLTNALMELMPVREMLIRGETHQLDVAPVTELRQLMATDYKECYA